MKVLVSGATGLVGRYIVEGLLGDGYTVIAGSRTPPRPGLFSRPVGFTPLSLNPDLDQTDAFQDAAAFVHAAFDHLPGKYRGGEGEDPGRFHRLNLDGTVKLFETARRAGVHRTVFLSSRAVYDGLPAGTRLHEDLTLVPDSLYGQIKLQTEHALAELATSGFTTASLRMTGVYGSLRPNKWDGLFGDYLAGKPVTPRAGTEVHGADVVAAVRLMLQAEPQLVSGQSFNLSDLVVDRRDILGYLPTPAHAILPPLADMSGLNIMDTGKIRSLGWHPGGKPLFARTMQLLASGVSAA
ncbi:NAD(P)-dependent oxidoreductase [Neorhizobium lilium]|uniref:UDP-glucose 4-epimerase n=1 Tax=Neorhizobium lilium TaxID=2503024 RepID=A0A3S3VKX5_9HYPH|nr:NAD(P)-dependent oxidoreductase [Neorhizobium lilium]RWX78996.1 NAD(P)-dependent oxidoreductase [Neorhizobium lilium]